MKNKCSFCGRIIDDEEDQSSEEIYMIKAPQDISPGVHICSECVAKAVDIINALYKEDLEEDNLDIPDFKKSKPSKIKKYLDQYIIGQDYAKEVLSTAVYNHYKMLKHKQNRKQKVEIEKSNILLVGPTGCGRFIV